MSKLISRMTGRPRTDVDDVSLLKFSLVRDTVADDFIDRSKTIQVWSSHGISLKQYLRADRFRELTVVQRRRVRITLDACVVHNLVDVIRRNAWFDSRRCDVEDFSGKLMVKQHRWV